VQAVMTPKTEPVYSDWYYDGSNYYQIINSEEYPPITRGIEKYSEGYDSENLPSKYMIINEPYNVYSYKDEKGQNVEFRDEHDYKESLRDALVKVYGMSESTVNSIDDISVLLQYYVQYHNADEQAEADKDKKIKEAALASIKEIQSQSTTGYSDQGYQIYSQYFVGRYQKELNGALDKLNYDKLDELIDGYLSKQDSAIATIKNQLYNIETTVKKFLIDAGSFFDMEFPYTAGIDAEVQALKAMGSKRTFSNADIVNIRQKLDNIQTLANIPSTTKIKYSDQSTKDYYTNLYNMLLASYDDEKNLAPVAIDSETWKDSEWLQEQLKIGNINLAICENGQLINKQYNTAFTYISEDTLSDADLTKAQADYEAEISRISKKEKKIDRELAMIETEHSAIEQEISSINTNKKDNIQQNFNLFS
jgi:signal peptidase I